MKKMITILVALSATVGLFAQGNNLITNGGFEKIVKRSLAQDKTLQNLTKRGWDFGAGPLVEMPNEWTPNASAGKVKLEIVKKAEKADNVHSGEYALKISNEKFAHIYTRGDKAGTYEFTIWAKGKGTVRLTAYCYGKNFYKNLRLVECKGLNDTWQKYTATVDIAANDKRTETFAVALTVDNGTAYVDDISMVKDVKK